MPPSNVIVDRRLLQALTQSVHSFFTRAEPLEWSEEHSALVEYGIGRFVDQHNKVKIEEPLVLVAVTRFFQTIANTPLQDLSMHLQLNQGQAFEEIVLLTMTKMFETPIKLSDIVDFLASNHHGQMTSHGSSVLTLLIYHPTQLINSLTLT